MWTSTVCSATNSRSPNHAGCGDCVAVLRHTALGVVDGRDVTDGPTRAKVIVPSPCDAARI